jgi:hypothetical protein
MPGRGVQRIGAAHDRLHKLLTRAEQRLVVITARPSRAENLNVILGILGKAACRGGNGSGIRMSDRNRPASDILGSI